MDIPARIKSAIDLHVTEGRGCGHFVTAVLENNLSKAVGGADPECFECLREIVKYVYNHIPGSAWGSPQNVRLWREKGGEKDGISNNL